ncbi:DUF5682 family protein [Microbulbifer aggregans]|uniref:DUF5682 family protein n=1 Tax=Microbulbifer aggregans TaxID=1769779 RepID=UPI001CFE6A1C|nr:DUF5682 family protein [Microbulbifer aggregans]
MPASEIHYFGIRHHGPGSAARLRSALDHLRPTAVLIEGPADCSDLLALLCHQDMRPPVALMAFASEHPECSVYFPFAEYSPEYQAVHWAHESGVPVSLIDLPVAVQLALSLAEQESDSGETSLDPGSDSEQSAEPGQKTEEKEAEAESNVANEEPASVLAFQHLRTDPIGCLATLAGYEDGESWWNDLIEQNSDSDTALFAQVAEAMAALREGLEDTPVTPTVCRELVLEAQREAYMRREIDRIAKQVDGPVAVICGAWHVPALQQPVTAKSDRDTLKSLPRKLPASKIRQAWIPWATAKLASRSGYGAGVQAPMWYQHLWQNRNQPDWLEHWLTQTARALRDNGHTVSTASVIEAARLCQSLAVVRERPAAGIEEVRDAVIACLCDGDPIRWHQLENTLLLGSDVGSIPAEAPLAPLLEDLQIQQRKCKLKPEALQKELALDLRSDSGLARSTLLHRLNILGVPWGKAAGSGNSRGTFREHWRLQWEPAYAVQLVENLVYGSTIESAAANKAAEATANELQLYKLAEWIQLCLEAQLPAAAEAGLARLSERASHTSDTYALLTGIPALININRYGTARDISLSHIGELIQRLLAQATVALPYACRNLDDEEAQSLHRCLQETHQALPLMPLDSDLLAHWQQALRTVAQEHQSSPLLAGLCARLLYHADHLSSEELQVLFQRTLSPAIATADAARFFDGFFSGATQQLLYDEMLLDAIQSWLGTLSGEDFVQYLPLFRRLFADLDSMERRRLMDTVLQGQQTQSHACELLHENAALWDQQQSLLGKLLQGESPWYK